ncbi:MAG: glycosyltransferase family 9 protein [Mesorhizobium sp.]|uniref:glycosyltransferase family 9 protein n=1 Tax=Mesorhizobium sp. TaxID=1871066 RepID=UPI0012155553|nr:glycosyltransferase family 9 protein [Mesorhizobium sp.]TIW11280.1 MAG: glycosyltransferase family 9 protein [Mesorhizobium sp.]
MGYGDQLMGSGLARGAAARGKRIALGDGRRILWDKHSEEIFLNNPNLAPPGSERAADIEWLPYYKGHRLYNRMAGRPGHVNRRWIWNLAFHAVPGELFFDNLEAAAGRRYGHGFIVIEPQSAQWKSVAPNKDWGVAKFQAVADRLKASGHRVVQFRGDLSALALAGVEQLATRSFRDALSVLANAALYIGGEGGLHHGAAAVGIPAVVLFGGFIPPSVTGYAGHTNLTGGAAACGSIKACQHCRQAMQAISIDDVTGAAMTFLPEHRKYGQA